MVTISFSSITKEEIQRQAAHFDENIGHVLTTVATILFILSLIFVVLRVATHRAKHTRYRIEDYLIFVALFFSCGIWIEALLAVKFGAGQHSMKVYKVHGVSYIAKSLQVVFALMVTYNITHLFIKLSILFFYRTLFTFVLTPFKYAWYTIFFYVCLNFIACTLIVLLQCRPVAFLWKEPFGGAKGECSDLKVIDIASGVIIALADLMLLLLPMPIFWSLHISVRRKVEISGLFALGSMALVASIIRVVSLSRVVSSVDFTYIEVHPFVWSVVEVNVGIICACIPTIKPLFSRQSTSANSTSNGYSNSGNTQRIEAIEIIKPMTIHARTDISMDTYPLGAGLAPMGATKSKSGSMQDSVHPEGELDFITRPAT